jgi:rfaE bifunctional protein nucleotidyltransferase chain/domain
MSAKIILDFDELKAVLDAHRAEGRTIVFGNGAFDLFHVGHVRYLKAAIAEGDIMIVAVNSDESVRKNKGPNRPIHPLAERVEILTIVEGIDYITMFGDETVASLLEKFRPDVHAKGTDYDMNNLPERDTVKRLGIRLVSCGDPKDHSTTELARKLGVG